jgi:hypothetical protein
MAGSSGWQLGDRFGGDVAAPDEPFVVLLDAQHPGAADQAAVVTESDREDLAAAGLVDAVRDDQRLPRHVRRR